MTLTRRFTPRAAGDIEPFTLDLSQWLTSGETVIGVAVTTSPNDLTVQQATFTSTTVTAVLANGTTGTDYTVNYTITTSAGRTETKSAFIFTGPN
jgi:hypothetical protein